MKVESTEYGKWCIEIRKRHPVIGWFPVNQWAAITRFNGWLPLPPSK